MRNTIRFLILATVFLLPATAWGQFEGGRSILTERKQSYNLGQVWVWTTDEGKVAILGQMYPLVEQEMSLLNITPSKEGKGKKPEKGSWNGTIGEPIRIDTELAGALPVLVRMNYRKLDRIDTKRQFHRIKIDEIPTGEDAAILVECNLGGDEEVRCESMQSTRPNLEG